MSAFKAPNPSSSKNPRRRITENASKSQIDEAHEIWHSTAIGEEMDDSISDAGVGALAPVTPIPKPRGGAGREGKVTSKKGNSDSGRGGSSTRDRYYPSQVEDNGDGRGGGGAEEARPSPVVINPPSGHGFLSSVLQRCGYIIRQPVSNNEMFHNVMKFRQTMAEWITENDPEMSRIETETSKFYKALHKYLSERPNFIASMMPTRHETELIQPSLLHCLLGIESLQKKVLDIVFMFLTEVSVSNSTEESNFVITILNQLKWLPTVVLGTKLFDDLFAILTTSSTNCQSQIIKYLPDIIPSALHSYVAPKLLTKFADEREQTSLNIALMDCFSALDLPQSYWSDIWGTAIDHMANASLQDIPAYFSFLFRADTSEQLNEVITAMREKVELKPPKGAKMTGKMDAWQVEILEKVEFCVSVNPAIVKVWTKQVKDDYHHQLLSNIKKIDLLMLFVFADADSNKQATAILKLLFTEKDLAMSLFDQLMKQNAPMVYQLFKTISQFLESLLRGRDTKCWDTVCDMTVCLFLGLSMHEAQTLMGNMTSILVNFPPSRPTVLKILTRLADQEPLKLLHFAPYLMGILEYVMQFPAGHIRSLMNILAILSQTEGLQNSNHFSAEFSILLRKQLTHSDLKIRCFGVFGAMASVRKMATQQIPNDAQIRDLLKLAWSFVERDEDACSIFLDELSSCVKDLPMDICKQYRATLQEKFQKLWTMETDLDERIKQLENRNGLNLKLVAEFDANKECTEERILINFENHPMSMSPLVVPAHLRVLGLLENKVEGSLVGIDAIIGMPVLFPVLKTFYERDSLSFFNYPTRYELGRYLVLAINFFRESICAFIADNDLELRVKIWIRLEHILKLQKLLVHHYDQLPGLPHAYVEERTIGSGVNWDTSGAGPSSGFQAAAQARGEKMAAKAGNSGAGKSKKKAAPKKGSSGSGGGGKKKKARTESVQTLDSDGEEEQGNNDGEADGSGGSGRSAMKKGKVNLVDEIQPKQILCHLRRLDVQVFEELLRKPINCSGKCVDHSEILLNLSAVSQNPQRLEKIEQFSPETLALILLELKRQVVGGQLEILRVKRLLKNVCKLVSQIQTALLEKEEESHPGVEGEESMMEGALLTPNQIKLESCLRLLIGIMSDYLEAVKKTDKAEKEVWIQKSIRIFVAQNTGRSKDNGSSQSQIQAMTNVATYLGTFVSIIRDSATALDHMRLLKTLHDLLEGNKEIKRAIDGAAKTYLQNDWKLPSAQVDGFLKIWLATSLSPMKIIKNLAEKLLRNVNLDEEKKKKQKAPAQVQVDVEVESSEDEEQGERGRKKKEKKEEFFTGEHYKSCQSTNFHTWYAAMFYGLSQYCYKNLRKRGDFEDCIQDWVQAVEIFEKLVAIVKIDSKKSKTLILASLLKNCRLFLEAFILGGAELLPRFWKEDQDAAQKFCMSLQMPCRTIQHICEHSKLTTDLQLLKSVPLVKRVLETLVFRIREVLAIHGASSAFTIGNLKHRDLKGGEIGSQIMRGLPDLDDDEISDEEEEASEGIAQAEFGSLAVDGEGNDDSRDTFSTAGDEEAMEED